MFRESLVRHLLFIIYLSLSLICQSLVRLLCLLCIVIEDIRESIDRGLLSGVPGNEHVTC